MSTTSDGDRLPPGFDACVAGAARSFRFEERIAADAEIALSFTLVPN